MIYIIRMDRPGCWPKTIENCAVYTSELIDGAYKEPVQIR